MKRQRTFRQWFKHLFWLRKNVFKTLWLRHKRRWVLKDEPVDLIERAKVQSQPEYQLDEIARGFKAGPEIREFLLKQRSP